MHGTFVPRTRWIRSQLTLVLRVYAYTAYSYHRDTAKRRRLGINLRPHLRGFCHRFTGAHSGRCHRHALILLRCRSCGPMPLIRTLCINSASVYVGRCHCLGPCCTNTAGVHARYRCESRAIMPSSRISNICCVSPGTVSARYAAVHAGQCH